MKKDLVKEAREELKRLRKSTLDSARVEITEAMTPILAKITSARLDEELGGGGDPPAGYDVDGEQLRMDDGQPVVGDTGEDLSDEGDGPAVLEGSLDDDDMLSDDHMFSDDDSDDMFSDDDEVDFGGEDDEF